MLAYMASLTFDLAVTLLYELAARAHLITDGMLDKRCDALSMDAILLIISLTRRKHGRQATIE